MPALLVAGLLLSGCTAAYDNDGEAAPVGRLTTPLPKDDDAVPVVVDTDLGTDDLVAIAYLMRHPEVRVLAVTVPTTGLVTCPAGVDLAHDLMRAVRVELVPVSCGQAPRGAHGIAFPGSWSRGAVSDSGLERDLVTSTLEHRLPAADLIGRLASSHPGLQVVALGPATELAALLAQDPASYARIERIVAMAGVLDGPPMDGTAGEWNAAADPDALAAVLDGPVPVTLVPHEVVPEGAPDGTRAPVVGAIGVVSASPTPAFWDLATAAYFTRPDAGSAESGRWAVSLESEPGRLSRVGDGPHRVVTSLDSGALDAAYREVFTAEEDAVR